MSWKRVIDPDERDRLLRKARYYLPDWIEWRFSHISTTKNRSKVVFRDLTEEKSWATIWFKNGEPYSFQYTKKLGE